MWEVFRAKAASSTERVSERGCRRKVGFDTGCLLRWGALGKGMDHIQDLVRWVFHVGETTQR